MSRDKKNLLLLIMGGVATAFGSGPKGVPMTDFWLNRNIRHHLNTFTNALYASFSKVNPLAMKFNLDEVQAVIDIERWHRIPFIFTKGDLDIHGALGTVVPLAEFAPFDVNDYWARRGMICHIKRAVYDLTTAATQLAVGPSTTQNLDVAVTLPGTTGFAQDIDIWVPKGFYVGLTTTNNAADTSVDLTIFGEMVQVPINGLDFGGTYYGGWSGV